jgi:ATP-dependent helicase/nuclease subunit B
VGWMRGQYLFDPVAVELPFGEDPTAPAWVVPLSNRHSLALHGRIDRVDLFRDPSQAEALCVVVDYKSSTKELDSVLMAHGLQLQLPAYLSVLRHWPEPEARFGVKRLIPAGVFYVNLRGRYSRAQNRLDALTGLEDARAGAYRHAGRFDARALPQLDARPGVTRGDQFNYRLTKAGVPYKNSREALSTTEFQAMLDSVEANLRRMGEEIFSGRADVSPFRKGGFKACDQCSYQAICRIDPCNGVSAAQT